MFSDGIVGYVRVSTANQVENGDGLEIQKSKILDYCRGKGLRFSRFYEDKGVSGAIKERRGLLDLLRDCEAGKIKRVVVYKQDRLSRELTVSLWLETQFKKYGIELNSVVDPEYDMEDPLQKSFKRIADIFAELEKDIITMRLKEGRINKAKNGKRGSGPIPFGYKKEGDKLEVEPTEASLVEKMFRWANRGFGYSKIVAQLNKKQAVTKRGRPFQIESVKYVLKNRLYYGEANFGDINAKGAHLPLISKRLFIKVQKRTGDRAGINSAPQAHRG